MSRFLVLTPDRAGSMMAGTAARHLEMARALAPRHDVTVGLPELPDEPAPEGISWMAHADPRLKSVAGSSAAILVQGHLLRRMPWLKELDSPLVVDLYDPIPLAHLQIGVPPGEEWRRGERHRICLGFTLDQLVHGDFFLAAHERARDFWLGMLAAAGRVDPAAHAADPTLCELIECVPTGVPDLPPPADATPPDHPAFGEGLRTLVWAGGIWDWMDADTLLSAFAAIARTRDDVRLVFMGVTHPNPDVRPMEAARRVRHAAGAIGLLDRQVYFADWTPYAQRHRFLLAACAGVSLHGDHVESRFAWRSRLLDHLWCGLPTVSTAGDPLGERMAAAGAALAVPPGSVDGATGALLALLDDGTRRASMADAARRLAAELAWSRVVAPLDRFLDAPRQTRRRGATSGYVDFLKEFLPHSPMHSVTVARARRVIDREGFRGFLRRAAGRASRAARLGHPPR